MYSALRVFIFVCISVVSHQISSNQSFWFLSSHNSWIINCFLCSLTFSSNEIESIQKYSYISKLNNQAFINDLSYSTAKTEENNAKFGILADSKIGAAIKIDDYGYFVTISDSFVGYNNGYSESNQNVFLKSKGIW